MRIASLWFVWFCAALSCAIVGGCIVTSAVEFSEEAQVPPVILDTPDLRLGAIIPVYQSTPGGRLRLGITVRDDNIDDVLEVQGRLSVADEPDYARVCPEEGRKITTSTSPRRERFDLDIEAAALKPGLCSMLEIHVSSEFRSDCDDRSHEFGVSDDRDDIASAIYWIWEMSGEPFKNPAAALSLVTSCPLPPMVP